MWIKEIIIDGFKSYKNRVVIPGFDSRFNAITGLNGSGKSNILDAICFVLGLTTLTLVINPFSYSAGKSYNLSGIDLSFRTWRNR
jgi:AAA15 family ATPase/GTPase